MRWQPCGRTEILPVTWRRCNKESSRGDCTEGLRGLVAANTSRGAVLITAPCICGEAAVNTIRHIANGALRAPPVMSPATPPRFPSGTSLVPRFYTALFTQCSGWAARPRWQQGARGGSNRPPAHARRRLPFGRRRRKRTHTKKAGLGARSRLAQQWGVEGAAHARCAHPSMNQNQISTCAPESGPSQTSGTK